MVGRTFLRRRVEARALGYHSKSRWKHTKTWQELFSVEHPFSCPLPPPPHSHTLPLSLSLSSFFFFIVCLSRFISSGGVSSERASRKKDARSGPLCQLVTWVAKDARENERKAPRDQGNGDRSCSHQEVFASSLLHRDISSFYSFLLCVRLNGKDVALGV